MHSGSFTNPGRATFGALEWYYWIVRYKSLKPSTIRGYETKLRKHIRPRFEKVKLSKITTEECQAFVDDLEGTDLSPLTINHIITIASTILNFAVKKGVLARNPFQGISKLTVPEEEITILDFEDLVKLASCVDGICREFLITVIFTGMRASEARGLQRRDIDLKNKFIHIRRSYDIKGNGEYQKPKTKSSKRSIPILAPLYDVLVEHLEKNPGEPKDPVFKGKGGSPLLWYHDSLKRALKRAELPEMSLHQIRH